MSLIYLEKTSSIYSAHAHVGIYLFTPSSSPSVRPSGKPPNPCQHPFRSSYPLWRGMLYLASYTCAFLLTLVVPAFASWVFLYPLGSWVRLTARLLALCHQTQSEFPCSAYVSCVRCVALFAPGARHSPWLNPIEPSCCSNKDVSAIFVPSLVTTHSRGFTLVQHNRTFPGLDFSSGYLLSFGFHPLLDTPPLPETHRGRGNGPRVRVQISGFPFPSITYNKRLHVAAGFPRSAYTSL